MQCRNMKNAGSTYTWLRLAERRRGGDVDTVAVLERISDTPAKVCAYSAREISFSEPRPALRPLAIFRAIPVQVLVHS